MKKILIMFIIWFLFINLLNPLSFKLLFDKNSYELPKNITLSFRHIFVPWLNFDGRNYLEIVTNGYNPNFRIELRVFFPLFPLLIRSLSFNLLLNPILIGLFISFSSILAGIFIFNKLLKSDGFKEKDRLSILGLLFLFPTSYYFLSFYTESIFLLLTLSVFYFISKKKFFLASILTALATATRITGLALLPAIFWEGYIQYKRNKKFPASTIIAPLGFVMYGLYLQLTTGNALAIVSMQKNWDRPIGVFGPFIALYDGLKKFIFASPLTRGDFFGHSMEVFEFIFAVFYIFILIDSFKKIKFSYWLFLLFSAIPIFFSGALSSIQRYMVVLFPTYIYLVKIINKKYFYLICFCFLILLIYFTSLFLRGYWVA